MRKLVVFNVLVILGLLLSACATPTAQVIEKEVTKVVEKEKVVEKTVVVEKEKQVEVTKVVEKEKGNRSGG